MTKRFRHGALVLLTLVLCINCASQHTRYPQCSRYGFAGCLQVDATTCDSWFDAARDTCLQQQRDNSMFASMPDSIQERNLQSCMLNEVVSRSGLPEEPTKDCLGR